MSSGGGTNSIARRGATLGKLRRDCGALAAPLGPLQRPDDNKQRKTHYNCENCNNCNDCIRCNLCGRFTAKRREIDRTQWAASLLG